MSLSTLRGSTKTKSFKITPPIPFEASEPKKLPKHKYQTFKVPITKGSKQTMKLEGYIYDSGNCEQYLLWKEQIESIINGLSIKKYDDKIKLIEQLCEGDLKNKLVEAMAKTDKQVDRLAAASEPAMTDDETFIYTMQQVTKSVFPKKALMLQKFYMSHYMRKGRDTKTKEYRARVATMTAQLSKYPPFQGRPSLLGRRIEGQRFLQFSELLHPSTDFDGF